MNASFAARRANETATERAWPDGGTGHCRCESFDQQRPAMHLPISSPLLPLRHPVPTDLRAPFDTPLPYCRGSSQSISAAAWSACALPAAACEAPTGGDEGATSALLLLPSAIPNSPHAQATGRKSIAACDSGCVAFGGASAAAASTGTDAGTDPGGADADANVTEACAPALASVGSAESADGDWCGMANFLKTGFGGAVDWPDSN